MLLRTLVVASLSMPLAVGAAWAGAAAGPGPVPFTLRIGGWPRPAPMTAAREEERRALLDQGAAALAEQDVPGARAAYERAAAMLHAADEEIGLVRTAMQAGEYRRAVMFGAHAAGAHRDSLEASVLQAWLLHLGGQTPIALRAVDDMMAAQPAATDLGTLREAIAQGRAAPPDLWVQLAPAVRSGELPDEAQAAGVGLLLPDQRHAVVWDEAACRLGVTATSRAPVRRSWVRDGQGRVRAARQVPDAAAGGLILLELDREMPATDAPQAAPRPPWPGSVALLVGHGASADAAPAWPRLQTAFVASPTEPAGLSTLSAPAGSGAVAGPVFDPGGRLLGLACAGGGAVNLLPVQRLVDLGWWPPAPLPTTGSVAIDAPGRGSPPAIWGGTDSVYEVALPRTLQWLREPAMLD